MAWTQWLRQAWGYVKSAIARGLGREEAREAYVAGGGEITEREWEDAWTLGEKMFAEGRAIQDFPGEAIIPRWMFEAVDIDYKGRYHMTAEVEFFNKATQEWDTKFVSANSDDLLTRADWEAALIEAIKRTETSEIIDLKQEISFYNFQAQEREA